MAPKTAAVVAAKAPTVNSKTAQELLRALHERGTIIGNPAIRAASPRSPPTRALTYRYGTDGQPLPLDRYAGVPRAFGRLHHRKCVTPTLPVHRALPPKPPFPAAAPPVLTPACTPTSA